jgi:hypothetical protein
MAERPWRTLFGKAKAMLHRAGMNTKWWAEAVQYASSCNNFSPSSTRGNKSPHEITTGKRPPLHILAPFGCLALARTPDEQVSKTQLQATSRECALLGLAQQQKDGYKLLHIKTGRIIYSRSVRFIANTYPLERTDASPGSPGNPAPPADDPFAEALDRETPRPDAEQARPQAQQAQPSSRRSSRITSIPAAYDPASYDAARRHDQVHALWAEEAARQAKDPLEPQHTADAIKPENPYHKFWRKSIQEECSSCEKNNTWSVVELPPGVKPVLSRFAFKAKRGRTGSVEKFKARLVAKGFGQIHGENFFETFAPTPKFATIRFLLNFIVQFNLSAEQLDVDSAYLLSKLPDTETVFMLPPGF